MVCGVEEIPPKSLFQRGGLARRLPPISAYACLTRRCPPAPWPLTPFCKWGAGPGVLADAGARLLAQPRASRATLLPLWKRGAGGDFCAAAPSDQPRAQLKQ